MACHELSALRLGLMNVLGIEDPAEEEHEKKELGTALKERPVLESLTKVEDLQSLLKFYQDSLVELQEKVSKMKEDDPKIHYYRSLLVLTKKVEQDLIIQIENLKKIYEDLDEIHHYLHEIYP
ncbi:MAG: DUF3209 domain-containing protein [Leptospiraceae bacterium]|nr:MAG: DUF3209 domain-containing protein [Leptospiraceae bacterium]